MRLFSADTRRDALQRMADVELDMLVIGGGITGCGIALDAASRGFSVGLVEREDFAAGTSGRSSRLVHGGMRYLKHLDIAMVAESVRERAILRRIAPHLVRPVPMYYPMHRARDRATYRAGLMIYDGLAVGRNIHRYRMASKQEVGRAAPGLARPAPGGVSWECRTDDARLVIEVARAAAGHGALLANHAEVVSLTGEGSVRGAIVADRMTGERFEVGARLTVNAAGVWADRVQALACDDPCKIRPSKGVHLVFRPGSVLTRVGLLLPSVADDGRFVFVVPWGDRVYAGTTDTEYDGDRDVPDVTDADRDYVFSAVARAFPGVAMTDVVASWAGLRPLLDAGAGPTKDLSRKHAIFEDPKGLLTITGGKLTTWRAMAEDMVDRAGASLGVGGGCRTKGMALGFAGDLAAAEHEAQAGAAALGIEAAAGRRLVHRYGDDWVEALALIRREPAFGEPMVDGLPVLKVEAELARTREMALTDEDVLLRRTRLSTMDAAAAAAST